MIESTYDKLTEEQKDEVAAASFTLGEGELVTDCKFLIADEKALDSGRVRGYRAAAMFSHGEPIKWGPPCFLDGKPMPEVNPGPFADEVTAVSARPSVAAPAPAAMVTMLPRTQVVPWQNPRTHFDEQRIADLRASMKKRGFDPAFPLIVRPSASGTFEIAAGERRWRAAGEEGIEALPCSVREMTDREMLETALIENLQHDSMTALDEALGYARLIRMGDTIADIAKNIGKTEAHVGQRLSLARLVGTTTGEALNEGAITPSHARLLARVPSAVIREELLQKVLKPSYGPGPMPVAELEKKIKLDYMIELRGAKFDQADATLVPMVQEEETGDRVLGGACGDCPHRELVSAASRVQLCMNPECFRAKEAAAFERWRAEVTDETKGRTALPAEDNARLWNHSGKALAYNSPYVELDHAPEPEELKAKVSDAPAWKKLIRGQGVPVILGRDADGKVHELAERKLVLEAARENEKEKPAGERILRVREKQEAADVSKVRESDEEHQARILAQQKARETERRVEIAAARVLLQNAKAMKKTGPEYWELVLPVLIEMAADSDELPEMLEVFGVTFEGDTYDEGSAAFIKQLSSAPHEHHAAIALLLVSTMVRFDDSAGWKKRAFKAFEVNVKEVERAVRAEMAHEEKLRAEEAAIAQGVSWATTKEKAKEFLWEANQQACNPDVAALDLPGGKCNALVGVARTAKGWVVGWEVTETKKKGARQFGEPCLANGVHYDSRALALRTGLIAVRTALVDQLSAGDEVQNRVTAYIASVEAPTASKKAAKKGAAK